MLNPAVVPVRAKIVEGAKRHPSGTAEKTPSALMGRADFADSQYWDQLARLYLPHYDLPRWNIPYTVEQAGRWLERLNISEKDWLRVGGYRDLQDFSSLNPRWPLRAFVGLASELRAERDAERTG